jgi:ABC-2 type transport system ATP-binding protein
MKNTKNSTDEVAIKVTNLHKEFLLPHQRKTSIKQAFVNIGRKNYKSRQKVLDGIDFEIKKGEFFGIVGRNGGGKSTLLKILAGVYHPTKGTVDINGELTPFIELGVGFNPELTGRDNIYLNGALLGFSRKDMDAMYNDIVAFAELEQFMDQKLKNYSSGMQVRLAFSIAIKAHNDILIFDEVLAVGDEAFQRKCIDVFEQYKANKQTVILVTHDMATVRQFCTRAMLINKGKSVEIGNPRKVAVTTTDNRKKQSFEVGDKVNVKVSWTGLEDMQGLGIHIFKASGEHVTGVNPRNDGLKDWQKKKHITSTFDLAIAPGKYKVVVEAFRAEGEVIDSIQEGPQFSVVTKDPLKWSGLTELPHTWDS